MCSSFSSTIGRRLAPGVNDWWIRAKFSVSAAPHAADARRCCRDRKRRRRRRASHSIFPARRHLLSSDAAIAGRPLYAVDIDSSFQLGSFSGVNQRFDVGERALDSGDFASCRRPANNENNNHKKGAVAEPSAEGFDAAAGAPLRRGAVGICHFKHGIDLCRRSGSLHLCLDRRSPT